jgi:putative transposase
MLSQRSVYDSKADETGLATWLAGRAWLSPSWKDDDPVRTDHFNQAYSRFIHDGNRKDMRAVPSQVLRNGASLCKLAISNHRINPSHFGPPKAGRSRRVKSVLLTNELFRFLPDGQLRIGTKAKPIGIIPVIFHRPWSKPKQIVISEDNGGRWFVSFSYDDGRTTPGIVKPSDQSRVIGVDRGVVVPFQRSDDVRYDYTPGQERSRKRLADRIIGLQRKLSRQQEGSNRRSKTKLSIGCCFAKLADIRKDFIRKAARSTMDAADVVVFENLKIRNMTASAKGTISEPGRRVKAKSGLNKSLLDKGPALYKNRCVQIAAQEGKTILDVNPVNSSVECATCSHVSKANRPSRDRFVCESCGNVDHADSNASKVIKKRGRKLIASIILRFISPPGTGGATRVEEPMAPVKRVRSPRQLRRHTKPFTVQGEFPFAEAVGGG